MDGAYLVRLIEIRRILFGGAASLSLVSISVRLSKVHQSRQFELSKIHDAVFSLISEVLRGNRQIRFSSLEHLWEDRILQSRTNELMNLTKYGKLQ